MLEVLASLALLWILLSWVSNWLSDRPYNPGSYRAPKHLRPYEQARARYNAQRKRMRAVQGRYLCPEEVAWRQLGEYPLPVPVRDNPDTYHPQSPYRGRKNGTSGVDYIIAHPPVYPIDPGLKL